MSNDGKIVANQESQAGMLWPKGSGKPIDFYSGLWIMGKSSSGELHGSITDFESNFRPGIINKDGTPSDTSNPRFRIYKISSDGSGDWADWPFDLGAPALKAQDGSDSLDAGGQKIPLLIGDQTLWWVMSDLPAKKTDWLWWGNPLGVEISVLAFAWDGVAPLSNTLFYEWTIHNKSTTDYDSCYIGLWDDPDIGDYSDDLVGCDPELDIGYCYNGRGADNQFFALVPAYAFQLLQGPYSLSNSEFNGLTAFMYFWDGGAPDPFGDPEDLFQAYNFIKGFLSDGSARIYYRDGTTTKYYWDGDPVAGTGYIDTHPGNRYMLMSSGPFEFSAGTTQTIRAAKVIAQGYSRLQSVTELKNACRIVKAFHDNYFYPQTYQPTVLLEAESVERGIELNWSLANNPPADMQLLGYKIYQVHNGIELELASFDKVDGVTEIVDTISGEEQIVYTGDENGLTERMILESDPFTHGPLKHGSSYQYRVKAFLHQPSADAGNKVLVSDDAPIHITHFQVGYTSMYETSHVAGQGDGDIRMVIVDPQKLTDHRYRVSFDLDPNLSVVLYDLTLNKTMSTYGFENKLSYDSLGFTLLINNYAGIKDVIVEGESWIIGLGYGSPTSPLNNAIQTGEKFYGSTVPMISLYPIRIDFQDQASVAEEGYWSKGAVYLSKGQDYAGIGELPMRVFDLSERDAPRRLNICFVEDQRREAHNMIWDMGWDGEQYPDSIRGDREWLFFMSSSYNEGADYNNDNVGLTSDVLYGMLVKGLAGHVYLQNQFSLTVIPNLGLTPEDSFELRASITTVEEDVVRRPHRFFLYQNYPNPFNATTTVRFEVEISARIEIDIYDILGRHVTNLLNEDKQAGTCNLRWNANRYSSGVYFLLLKQDANVVGVKKMLLVK